MRKVLVLNMKIRWRCLLLTPSTPSRISHSNNAEYRRGEGGGGRGPMKHHRIVRRELIYKQQAGKDTERYSVDELREQKLNV